MCISRKVGLYSLVLLSTLGCRKEVSMPSDQSTPQEVLGKQARAIRDRDFDRYLACWAFREEDREIVEEMFAFVTGIYDFKDALVARHGNDAWARFNAKDSAHATPVCQLTAPPLDVPWWQDVEAKVENDRAQIVNPYSGELEYFAYRDGIWRGALLASNPSEDDRRNMRVFIGSMAKAVKFGAEKAKEPAITIPDLKQQMSEVWAKELGVKVKTGRAGGKQEDKPNL
jgi:hypothetical protein